MPQLVQYPIDGSGLYMDPITRTTLSRIMADQVIIADIIFFDDTKEIIIIERCSEGINLADAMKLIDKKFPLRNKIKRYIPYDSLTTQGWRDGLPGWY